MSVTWVDAAGNVHESPAGSDEARALCGGVGVLGAIAELTLQMTPLSATKISTWYVRDDGDLADDIERMLRVRRLGLPCWVAAACGRGSAGSCLC